MIKMPSDTLPEYSTQITKEIDCPFCNAGKIKVSYKPSMLRFKVSRISAGTKRTPYRTSEKYVVISTECPSCHKSKSEIDRRFKEGKSASLSDAARKAKELGLPTRI